MCPVAPSTGHLCVMDLGHTLFIYCRSIEIVVLTKGGVHKMKFYELYLTL